LSDKNIVDEIHVVFGKTVIQNRAIDRNALAKIVFESKEALNKLNAIVHPKVMHDFLTYCNGRSKDKFVIFESALIFEADLTQYFDKTVLVYTPFEVKVKRVMSRDKCDRNTVLKRLSNQTDDELKLQKVDDVIVNDDTVLVMPQVLDIYRKYSL